MEETTSYSQDEADLLFVLHEVAQRRRRGLATANHVTTHPLAALAGIPHPNGGFIPCGMEAYRRIDALAERYLAAAPEKARHVGVDQLAGAIRTKLGLVLGGSADAATPPAPSMLLDEAFGDLERKFVELTYYSPIGLAPAEPARAFSLGPVRFLPVAEFLAGPGQEFSPTDAAEFLSLGWVAGISTHRASREVAVRGARASITAALDMLRLLARPADSRRLVWLRPNTGLATSMYAVQEDGAPAVADCEGHYEFVTAPSSWIADMMGEGLYWVEATGRAIEASRNGGRTTFGDRALDAARWYSSGVLDDLASARIVKFMTAVECVLRFSEGESGLAELLERATDLVGPYSPTPLPNFPACIEQMYTLRSQLVHGGRSPLDSSLIGASREHAVTARHVVLVGLNVFDVMDLSRPHDHKRLKVAFRYIADRNKTLARREQSPAP